jgi:hypothetical protein
LEKKTLIVLSSQEENLQSLHFVTELGTELAGFALRPFVLLLIARDPLFLIAANQR